MKPVSEMIGLTQIIDGENENEDAIDAKKYKKLSYKDRNTMIEDLTAEMRKASEKLDFERAAKIRDKIKKLKTIR